METKLEETPTTPKLRDLRNQYNHNILLDKSPAFQIINDDNMIFDGEFYEKSIPVLYLCKTTKIIRINDDTIFYNGYYYKKVFKDNN